MASLGIDDQLLDVVGQTVNRSVIPGADGSTALSGIPHLTVERVRALRDEYWISSVGDLLQVISSSNYRVDLESLLHLKRDQVVELEAHLRGSVPQAAALQVTTMQIFGLGAADQADGSALKRVTVPELELDESANHIPDMPPILSQGQRGTCVAFASTGVHEHFRRVNQLGGETLSPQHLYYECKARDNYPGSGTYPNIAATILADLGQCLETEWPYESENVRGNEGQGPPPPGVQEAGLHQRIAGAVKFKAVGAGCVHTLKAILAGYVDDGQTLRGRSILFGVPLFANFTGGETARAGKVFMPLPGEQAQGGHAMAIVGYRDGPAPGGGYFIVRNSWGTDWGGANPDGPGHCHIPYAYMEKYGRPDAYAFVTEEEWKQLHSGTGPSTDPTRARAVERLNPGLVQWMNAKGWTGLRPIQEEGVHAVLDGADVLISASTAGGKTEAAFLPALTGIAGVTDGVGCLAIAPLKALIDDQYDRLHDMARYCEIPVCKWHGGVSASAKARLLKDPRGLLIITPESLEAILCSKPKDAAPLFAKLKYIVVDELHAFIGSERGRQLQSLMTRVEAIAEGTVQRIALSATIGDMDQTAEYLRPGGGPKVEMVVAEDAGKEPVIQIRAFECADPGAEESDSLSPIADTCFDLFAQSDNLIFANSRQRVELLATMLRDRAVAEGLRDVTFLPHHGSLSESQRRFAEAELKDGDPPTSLVCTSTMELGIDVGHVSTVAQVRCPPGAASLRQRLGRSGRSGDQPSKLVMMLVEDALGEKASLGDRLRTELVQSCAIVELLRQRWFEPPPPAPLHLSTLIQQILSMIKQRQRIDMRESWALLCKDGPFRQVDQQTYIDVLRALKDAELVAQDPRDGRLMLGAEGTELLDFEAPGSGGARIMRFVAAFNAPMTYRLHGEGALLGQIPIASPISVGMTLAFGGRHWTVDRFDRDKLRIDLSPGAGGKPPRFLGTAFRVHGRVRAEMRALYESDHRPAYLDESGLRLLAEGRQTYRDLGLADRGFVETDRGGILLPWSSDVVAHTLAIQLRAVGLEARAQGITISVPGDQATTRDALVQVAGRAWDPVDLASGVENQIEEKNDHLLTPALLAREYAARAFDLNGSAQVVASLLGQL